MASLDNQQEIRAAANVLLRKAAISERLPTPVEELIAAAELMEDPDYEITESKIKEMPAHIQRLLRSAQRKIQGVLDRRERVIFVNPSLTSMRKKFVKLHEVSHDIFPWQRDLVVGETKETLSPYVQRRFEQEANQGAAELFFQIDLLQRVAADHPIDIATPLEMAQLFGASFRATFRHWLVNHGGCACGFVTDLKPYDAKPSGFKRHECLHTTQWEQQFGARVFPSALTLARFPFLGSLTMSGNINCEWSVQDSNGDARLVNVQSFCNTYHNFVLVFPPQRGSFIARHRKAPTISLATS